MESRKKSSFLYARFERSSERPEMVSWLIKGKWVRSEREAVAILLLVVFMCILGTLFFTFYQNPVRFFYRFYGDRGCVVNDQIYNGNGYGRSL